MTTKVLIDTGPIVAAINVRDKYHSWALALLARLRPPLFTCDAVLAEACFLLQRLHGGSEAVLKLVERGVVKPDFPLFQHVSSVAELMKKYSDVPMSLADGCLVRMCELNDDCELVTCDSDFRIYRRHGRRTLPLLMPA